MLHRKKAAGNEETRRKSARPGPSSSRTYSAVCIFCQKESKYTKAQKTKGSSFYTQTI